MELRVLVAFGMLLGACGGRVATAPDRAATAPDGGTPTTEADGGGEGCPAGQTLCDGACVDESSDVANCGGCGVVCSGTCTAGRCLVTIASGQQYPFDIAVDTTSVYWTCLGRGNTGSVMKAPIGGGPSTALASNRMSPSALTIDATSVYWTESSGSPNPPGNVMKTSLTGGPLVTLASGQSGPFFIAVDAANVYWENPFSGDNSSVYDPTTGTLMSVPLAGGTPKTLAALDVPYGLAVNSTSLYITALNAVFTEPLAGGTPSAFVTGPAPQDQFAGIVLDAKNAYWLEYEGHNGVVGNVMSAPLGGGPVQTLVSQQMPGSIAVDATHLYWTNTAGALPDGGPSNIGSVMRVPLGGGTPVTLASGQNPGALAVDATSVYWVNAGDGTVMKLTPK